MRYSFQRNKKDNNNLEVVQGSDVGEGLVEHSYPENQENAFIKYITQVNAVPNVIPNKYLRRYARRVLFSGKTKALAFITNPKTIRINTTQLMNLTLEEDAEQEQLADETVWDNIDLMQVTRGTRGNLQNALITQRREFRDTSEKHKPGLLGSLFKKKEPEIEEDNLEEGY